MLHLRRLVLLLSASILLALPAAAQAPETEGEIDLSANETYVVLAPPLTPSTLVPFQVSVEGRDDDGFDVTVSDAGATVSLLLPGGTEINSLNAASLGYGFDVVPANDPSVTSGMLTSSLSLSGTHTLINLPSTAPVGTYQIKVNTSGVTTPTAVYAAYLTDSPIRSAVSTDAETYHTGGTVVFSVFLFDGTTPITNASVEAYIADAENPSMAPVQVTVQDSGPHDAAPGDGIYTGVYTATAEGKFLASIRATGTSTSGAAYARTTSTSFRVLPPLADFDTFADAGIDDNANNLIDRIAVTANVQVQQPGNYSLELTLAASNGHEARARAAANMLAGAGALTASFTASQILSLGVDGPYTIKNATLVYVDDPEQPVAAFREDAGATAAYALSSIERPAIKFTGNNTVTGIDTNANGKFDLLRITAEVNTTAAATYEWSGTLRDAAGREIQALDGTSNMTAGNNVITFDFDGVKIAQHGADGPYALTSVLVFNDDAAVNINELLRTQAFSVNDFECSGAPSTAVQSVTLTPATIVGGNATTLHVTLAEPAGTCGSKVTISSDNPALVAAALPATVIVPAGQSAANVTIITAGVAATTQINLTATSGTSSQSAALSVTPSSLSNFSLNFTTVKAGGFTKAKVELDGAAPAGGATVSLASGNPAAAPLPANVVVPGGERIVEYLIETNAALQGSATFQLSASYAGVTKTATLTVYSEVNIEGSITPGGAPVTVNAAEPGQNFLLAFTGVAGQRISVRMTGVTIGINCCGTHVSIKKPDGSNLLSPIQLGTNGGFIDATTLPVSGTYTLVVDPDDANTGSMTVTMYDVPPDIETTITPGGPPVTVSPATPGQNARLTFAGAAGQRVSLKVSGVTINTSYVSFFKPDGTPLAGSTFVSTSGTFVDTLTLPAAGTYTILLDPVDFYTGNATLTLYDVPADVTGSIMPGGAPVTVTTTAPGQRGVLNFNGTAGQRVSLKISGVTLTGGNGYVNVYLRQPDGTTLASANFVSSGGGFIDVQTLPTTGSYTILVQPQETNTGSLTLTLYNVPADVTGNISVGTPLTLTTTVPGQNSVASFNGAAGQRVTLNIGVSLTGGSNYADVTLRKPDGTTLASANMVSSGGGFINLQTLPVAGVYTVYVNPQSSSTGGVTLTLNDVSADVVGTINFGSSTTVTTTTAGQNARLTFEGTAGQRVSVNSSTTFGGCWYIGIYKPDGTQLSNTFSCGSTTFVEPLTLPSTGTYTILIDPSGSQTGSATVTLYDVVDLSGSATVGGPAVTTNITTPGQISRLAFDGTSGQRVSVTSSSTFSGCWYLGIFKADGTQLSNTFSCGSSIFLEPLTLPATGTYMLTVNPSGSVTGSATVRLYDVADTSGTTSIGGSPVTVTTGTPGQVARLSFNGTAGQKVSVNSSSAFNGCWNLGINKPDGTQLTNVFSCSSSIFIEPQTLPTSGTYTLVVDPSGSVTGSATVTLYNVVDQTGIAEINGASVSTTISTPGQVTRLTFDGTAGQRVSVNSSSNFTTCWNLGIYKPDGTQLSNTFNCGSTFVEPQTLPSTGTYTLLIDPSAAGTGTATVTLYQVVDLTGTLTVNGSTVGLTTTAPGQNAALTFAGTSGQQLTVRVTGSTYSCVTVTLRKPDNTSLTSTFTCGSSFNLATQTLPSTGTYTVTVDPNGASTGSISVRVTSP